MRVDIKATGYDLDLQDDLSNEDILEMAEDIKSDIGNALCRSKVASVGHGEVEIWIPDPQGRPGKDRLAATTA